MRSGLTHRQVIDIQVDADGPKFRLVTTGTGWCFTAENTRQPLVTLEPVGDGLTILTLKGCQHLGGPLLK